MANLKAPTYTLTILEYSLLIGGISIDKIHHKYEKFYVISFIAFVVIGGCAIFVIFDQVTAISEKTEVVYALFGAKCVGMVFLTFQLNKTRLREIYFKIENMYDRVDDFAEISNRLCAKIVSKYKIHVILMVVFTFSIPPMIATFTKAPLGDLRTLIIPSWYPWSKTTTSGYLLTITVQVLTMLAAYSLLVSVVAFIAASVIAIYVNYQLLTEKLTGLDSSTDDSWEAEMKILIAQHSYLMNREVTELAVNFVNVLLYTVFGEVVSLISVFVQVEREHLYKLKLVSACSIMMSSFFSYCVAGEKLLNLKDDVKYAFYETQWYNKDMKTRRIILLFMILNKNPIRLKAFDMYHINLPFTLAIARKCYTVVQFLQTIL